MAEQLLAKIFISGKLEAKTGMHIGGSSTALDIGGIDNNVIKTARGVPYIPGSSLKGKLRSLVEIKNGFTDLCNELKHDAGIAYIFGTAKSKETKDGVRSRLIVRDAFLDVRHFTEEAFADQELELGYTESKWENKIERASSKAEHPRQMERVPAGAHFDLEMVYSILQDEDIDRFKTLLEGMRLLEDDYLGGSGSRGYGKVQFQDMKFEIKKAEQYRGDNQRQTLDGFDACDLSLNVDDLIKKIREKLNSSKQAEGGNAGD